MSKQLESYTAEEFIEEINTLYRLLDEIEDKVFVEDFDKYGSYSYCVVCGDSNHTTDCPVYKAHWWMIDHPEFKDEQE